MNFVGIDVAKHNHEASVIDNTGNLLSKSISFSNTFKGCQKLIELLNKLSLSKEEVVIGMEATGHYWLSLYSYLIELDYDVKVINPIQSDSFRNVYIRQTKTDSKDSFIIAEIMRFGRYSNTQIASDDMLALRQLSRFRMFLVDECSDLKRKVITILDQVFPEYASLFSNTFGLASKEVLLQYPTPEDILNIETDKLVNILEAASRGRFKEEKALQLQEAARSSFGIKIAKDAFSFQIHQLIEQITFVENQIKDLENEITHYLETIGTFITTITGIGPVLGATIVSEIGDITRFSDCSKLVAFAGLDASVKQSGEFDGNKNHISKRGSPYLRRAIWNAAMVASFNDPVLSQYYQKKRAEGKHHSVAIGAVARKLTNIIFAVLRDNKPYTIKS
jgi:transposase